VPAAPSFAPRRSVRNTVYDRVSPRRPKSHAAPTTSPKRVCGSGHAEHHPPRNECGGKAVASQRALRSYEWSLRRDVAVSGPWAVSSAENCRLSWGPIMTGRRWEVKYLRKRGLYGIWHPNRWGLSRHIPLQGELAYETRPRRSAWFVRAGGGQSTGRKPGDMALGACAGSVGACP
jgi:hypothetical protein